MTSWFLVAVFGVVAVLSSVLAIDGQWFRLTVLDTEGYLEAIARPLAADPAVKDALAGELTNQLLREINLVERIEALAPAQLRATVRGMAADIDRQWRTGLRPGIRKQLDDPGFAKIWGDASASAHAQLISALTDRRNGASVVLDLHAVVAGAVRDAGAAIDRQFSFGIPLAVPVFDGIAETLSPDVGRVDVDLSRIGPQERWVVAHAGQINTATLVTALLAGTLAVLLAGRRGRGGVLVLVGSGLVLLSAATWVVLGAIAASAADRAATADGRPLSAELRRLIDIQSALAVRSFRDWVVATVLVGLVVAVLGFALAVAGASRRDRPDPAARY